MSPKPAGYRITGPGGLTETVLSSHEAVQRKRDDPRSTVQMMVWADLVGIVRETRADARLAVLVEVARLAASVATLDDLRANVAALEAEARAGCDRPAQAVHPGAGM